MGVTGPTTGCELALFAGALVWKSYLRDRLGTFLVGDVLEVGAGIGATTQALRSATDGSWTALEPDAALFDALRERVGHGEAWTQGVRPLRGSVASLARDLRFDSILYVDVLEHIYEDREELLAASALLRPSGRIVTLSPAHQFLMSPFDRAIGHHRRYSRRSLRALTPPGLHVVWDGYLDSVGVALSIANRLALRRSIPSPSQIAIWDRRVVPISRRLDRILGYRFGKSVVVVWARDEPDPQAEPTA